MAFKAINESRLFNIPVAKELFAHLLGNSTKNSVYEPIIDADGNIKPQGFHYIPELGNDRHVYNMPFILNSDGTPWDEANAYFYNLLENEHSNNRPTDKVTRIASQLLQYKIYTEKNNIDYLNFNGKRLSQRPTANYYEYLKHTQGYKPRVLNQHTKAVYEFYEYIYKNWKEHKVDIDRVDSIKTLKMYFINSNGSYISTNYKQRLFSEKTGPRSTPELGSVRDEGEDLRPLNMAQFKDLKMALTNKNWTTAERLMIAIAYQVGARKQSILTIRIEDVETMYNSKLSDSGTIEIKAGPGTNINTKNSKNLTLYFPRKLVDELYTYCNCEDAKERRIKFKENFKEKHPDLEPIPDDKIYLFLSDQGNCYYMAKDDPRYKFIKRPPSGQVSSNLQNKIQKYTSNKFPSGFYFHWLRATFGYLLYLSIKKKINELKTNGDIDDVYIDDSDIITIIQKRMGHKNRKTTEDYLKLFDNISMKIKVQEIFEEFFIDVDIDDLLVAS